MWFRKPKQGGRRVVREHRGRPIMETLERKEMLSGDAPVVVDITADNRGLVSVVVDRDLNNATVNQSSVRVFTAGDDGLLGTGDDEAVTGVLVSYTFDSRTITADARLEAGTLYGVVLDGSIIASTDGCLLDGEFNGPGVVSGDGAEGGDLRFFARNTGPTIARIATNLGDIDIELFADETPITVANFFAYANSLLYDGTFFHRSAQLADGTPFVIQGGGFEANTPFLPIDTFDPILNEPGISNLRGTIAMAKLGGDPNSATSQWFFNIGDNSANLDNQNGGFTVFGEILNDDGLAVMDAIAALERFDASITSGAFGDVPVLDLDLIESTSNVLMRRDLVQVLRVSELFEISDEPFGQLDTDEIVSVTADNSDARVTFYSLSGDPLGDINDFVRVRFGSGGAVDSVRIIAALPEPIGIQISGATAVGSITDARRADDGNLAFVVSNASVQSIDIRHSITGAMLNGVLLADNTLLPEDIDADGDFADNTAIFIADGESRSLRLRAGVEGADVFVPGGLASLRVDGLARDADFRTGPLADDNDSMSARFADARDVVLVTQSPISSFRADDFVRFDTQQSTIDAPSIGSLRVRGDFIGALRLSETTTEALGSVRVTGDVLRSQWNIVGNVGPVRVGGSSGWTLDVVGDLERFRAGDLINFTAGVTGSSITLRAADIDGAEISLGGLRTFVVSPGALVGEVSIGSAGPFETRVFRVRGDVSDSDITLATASRNFKLGGDIARSSIQGTDFGSLRFKQVVQTEFLASGSVRDLTAVSWDGGSVQASEMRFLRTTGSARIDDAGDYSATTTISNVRVFRIAGSIEDSNIQLGDNRDFRVGDGVEESEVRFFQLFFFADKAAGSIDIGGRLLSSEIYVGGNVDSLRFGAVEDSGVYVGSTAALTGFAAPGAINPNSTAGEVIVRGTDGASDEGFVDSFIVGGQLPFVQLANTNFGAGAPFGVAGFTIGRVNVTADGFGRGFVNLDAGVSVQGELEIRPNFLAP